ncbi:MAG TPA: DUF5985 family protein [Polyangiaceae bacterium]|nr:DUF5985 family protein [Polyangiaceae bacterium]
MAELTYVLCALVSIFCAALLIRNYFRTRLRLALLACLCFAGLALNNVLLWVDLVMTPPEIDLRVLRGLVALVALTILVAGLVLEEK